MGYHCSSHKLQSLNVKVVNKDVVLFKAFDEEKNYSESGIINRKSGELVHEITIGLKSDNPEKKLGTLYADKIKK